MAREYAKELTWAGQIHAHEQLWISAEQHRRQASLQGRAAVVITDAPVPQGVLFAPLAYREPLLESLLALTRPWNCLNVLVNRTADVPYEQDGRSESPERAGMHHAEVTKLARSLCGGSLIETTVPEALAHIMPHIQEWYRTHSHV